MSTTSAHALRSTFLGSAAMALILALAAPAAAQDRGDRDSAAAADRAAHNTEAERRAASRAENTQAQRQPRSPRRPASRTPQRPQRDADRPSRQRPETRRPQRQRPETRRPQRERPQVRPQPQQVRPALPPEARRAMMRQIMQQEARYRQRMAQLRRLHTLALEQGQQQRAEAIEQLALKTRAMHEARLAQVRSRLGRDFETVRPHIERGRGARAAGPPAAERPVRVRPRTEQPPPRRPAPPPRR